MGLKYIVLEIKTGDTKREWPIVFPDMMVHKQVAERMSHLLVMEHELDDPKIIAAGSVSFFWW